MTKILTRDEKGIPFTFLANGYNYRLLKIEYPLAIYARFNKMAPRGYETVILRKRAKRMVLNQVIPATISLPKDEEFGLYGWSYFTLPMAEQKFKELRLMRCSDVT